MVYQINEYDWCIMSLAYLIFMTTEGLMLSCMIDAMVGREVATANIPGAFLQT